MLLQDDVAYDKGVLLIELFDEEEIEESWQYCRCDIYKIIYIYQKIRNIYCMGDSIRIWKQLSWEWMDHSMRKKDIYKQ
jgi:hypothetical protein